MPKIISGWAGLPDMADDTETNLHFDPYWRRQICRPDGKFFDPRVERDYGRAVADSIKILLKVKREAYLTAARKSCAPGEGLGSAMRALAQHEALQCVDSMDWKRHQMSLSDPDPKAPGRIRIVRDFAAEDSLAEVSRSEMNRSLAGGAHSSLRGDGPNYVGLGRSDLKLNSDQVIEHFALPRDKSRDPDGAAQRSDLRLSYHLQKGAGGRQFALVDDCASGRWTIKEPGRAVRSFERRGGGRQAVIIEGGDQFAAARVSGKALAWNRAARRPETVDLKETPCASQHRQSLTFSRQNSL